MLNGFCFIFTPSSHDCRRRHYVFSLSRSRSYFYHAISRMAWTILTEMTSNIHYPLPMTWLDSWGQRSRSQKAIEVKSCEHHISRTTWAISMKLTGNNHWPWWMTWLDVGGQKSRSHLGSSMWWGRHRCRRWGVEAHPLVFVMFSAVVLHGRLRRLTQELLTAS